MATRPMSERPKIVDMRCRLTTTEGADYFRQRTQHSGVYAHLGALQEGTIEAFFRDLDEAGVTTAVSASGNNPGMTLGYKRLPDRTTSNDHQAEIQKQYWGRFIGTAGIDASGTFHNPLEEIERCAKMGLRVVFIEPGRDPINVRHLADARLYPIYQKCVDLDLAICPQTSGPLGGKNIEYADPKYIDQVAEDFPDLRIICGHANPPYIRELIVVAGMRRENVYASPDGYLLRIGTRDWVKAVNSGMMAGKFIWGSAYPLRTLKPYADAFFSLPWNDDVLDRICYRNALHALKLEDDPTFKEIYGL